MAEILLEGVSKTYADGTLAVDDVSLTVPDGACAVLVGPSGCGKTTLLRMIAGLETITGGTIAIDGEVINSLPPQQRDIAMVFQSYALYPHMTVAKNMAFGLRRQQLAREEVDRRVREAAIALELTEYLGKKPAALSGGQRQRVAMGRAIVRRPRAFLMDEPLSNLDAKLRTQMRAEIARLRRDLGATTVYVTHDQTEAMTLGDVVAVMHRGKVQQLATPEELFERPANLFVAGFIGAPAMSFFEATIEVADGRPAVVVGSQRLLLDASGPAAHPGLAGRAGEQVIVGIRPDDIAPLREANGHRDGSTLTVVVELRETLGRYADVHFTIEAPAVIGVGDNPNVEDPTDIVLPAAEDADRARLVARVRASAPGCEVGDRVTLVVDTGALHFFDPAMGLALGRSG
jgi:multiple sugar transport system ATP-binding protein